MHGSTSKPGTSTGYGKKSMIFISSPVGAGSIASSSGAHGAHCAQRIVARDNGARHRLVRTRRGWICLVCAWCAHAIDWFKHTSEGVLRALCEGV